MYDLSKSNYMDVWEARNDIEEMVFEGTQCGVPYDAPENAPLNQAYDMLTAWLDLLETPTLGELFG